MAWDDTKSDFETRGDVAADEKLTAAEWNQHITDGHFPADEVNFGVDGNGDPVITDPQNADAVIARYDRGDGQWVLSSLSTEVLDTSIRFVDPVTAANINTVANDLLDSLSAGEGGTVKIKAGTHELSGQFNLHNGVTIAGDSPWGTQLDCAAAFPDAQLIDHTPTADEPFAELKDIRLTASGQQVIGLKVDDADGGKPSDAMMERAYFSNFANQGVLFEYSFGWRLRDVWVENCGSNAGYAAEFKGSLLYTDSLYIAVNNSTYGARFAGNRNHHENLQIASNTGRGGAITGGSHIFTNLWVVDNKGSIGLLVDGGETIIDGAFFDGNAETTDGLVVSTSDAVRVTGAWFKGHTGDDVRITAPNTGAVFVNCRFDGSVDINGNFNHFIGCTFNGTIAEAPASEGNSFNGWVRSPETLDMGGSSGTVTPTQLPTLVIPIFVDAGGSAVNLRGVNGITNPGQRVQIIHTGGENVTLENAGSVTNRLLNQSGSNDTLSANGHRAEYVYDEVNTDWRQTWINTQ